jgi:hypothetical protein
MSALRKFFSLPAKERNLFFAALWQLLRCRVLFLLLPYATLESKFQRHPEATHSDTHQARRIRAALRRASALSIWRNKCLVQTFAARALLNRRRITSRAFLGVQSDGTTPDFAHAWLVSDETEIVPSYPGYVRVHEF